MLLNDLLALFSSQLNIDLAQFNSIIESNNIKLNQKLVLEKKKITNQDLKHDLNHETNNVPEKRSRGRPRKQCNVISVPNIISEDIDYIIVEEISYKDKDYYKTDADVLLDTNYNACGRIVDGAIIFSDLKT
jgi:23S rRNA-/tRNA-specific pseudouridylate synthase